MNPSEMTGPQIRAAIKKAQDEVRDEARRGELYAKHGHKHLVKEIDPVNISGSNTPGGGAGGLWPQMHTPTTLTVSGNAITVTQDYHLISTAGGTINTINGGVVNKLVMFQQASSVVASPLTTWQDQEALGSGNINIYSSRYNPLSPGISGGSSFKIVWGSQQLSSTQMSQAAVGWLGADGNWTLIDLSALPMRFFTENGFTGATSFDAGGSVAILSTSEPSNGGGALSLYTPNASSMVKTISAGVLDRINGDNYWSVAPESGTADDLTSLTPIANSLSNNTSGRMYTGDWVIISPATAADTITLKHNTGTSGSKLFCPGDTDLVLTGRSQAALLVGDKTLDTAAGGWRVFSLAGGGGASSPTAGFWPIMNAATTLTIASGAITVTQDHHIVRTEGAAESDVLDTINGTTDNKWLVLRSDYASGEFFTLSTSGNILPVGNPSYTSVGSVSYALLWYNPTISKWMAFVPNSPLTSIVATDSSSSVTAQSSSRIEITGNVLLGFANVTIASDKVTGVSQTGVSIDTEGAAATDDLISIETVSGSGDWLLLTAANETHTVVLKHNNAGGTVGYRIFTQGGTDIVLDGPDDFVMLVRSTTVDSGNGGWMAIANSDTISKSVTATLFGGTASTTIPRATVGPMLQGGTIISCKAKKADTITAIGATAWIGDIHLITAANSDTNSIGTTIFSTKPTITNTHYYDAASALATTTFAAGDWFAFFTDQVGTNAGNILVTLEVVYNR